TNQLHARRRILAQITAGISLDREAWPFLGGDELDELIIGHNAHRKTVHLRRFGGERLRTRDPGAACQSADERGDESRAAGTQQTAPRHEWGCRTEVAGAK